MAKYENNLLLRDTLVYALAGGEGTRLHPLTLFRAKPSMPIGAKWTILDLVLWSLYQSGFRTMLALVQYHAESIRSHINSAWPLKPAGGGQYVEVISPEGLHGHPDFRGTADAVYQNLHRAQDYDYSIVVGGDHVFLMNGAQVYEFHRDTVADVSIMALEVSVAEARAFGVLVVDENSRIIDFQEKPSEPSEIPGKPGRAYASMGIYFFTNSALNEYVGDEKFRNECIQTDKDHVFDFGKHVLPKMVADGRNLFAYPFADNFVPEQRSAYWRDVGTIDAYVDANLDLAGRDPALNLYTSKWPIPTRPDNRAPGKSANRSTTEYSLFSGSCILNASEVMYSVLCPGVTVDDSELDHVIVFPDVSIGSNCSLRNCIIDEGQSIPPGTVIGQNPIEDVRRFKYISERGTIVIPRNFNFE